MDGVLLSGIIDRSIIAWYCILLIIFMHPIIWIRCSFLKQILMMMENLPQREPFIKACVGAAMHFYYDDIQREIQLKRAKDSYVNGWEIEGIY